MTVNYPREQGETPLKKINYQKSVRYELMHGTDAARAIADRPVGFLPVGCLERHGDHLPMGLDIIKAHGICCEVARAAGGVVFPPHYYAGIHKMGSRELQKYTGSWGNIYTDSTAEESLMDIIRQIALTGIKVIVLYTGHYPECQVEMISHVAKRCAADDRVRVIPFAEMRTLGEAGDHAGISETSFMLYLDRSQVDMRRIHKHNYEDHKWDDENTPEKASAAKGESDIKRIIEYLGKEIETHLG